MTTKNIEEVFSSGVFKTYKKNTSSLETPIEHPIRILVAFVISVFLLSPLAFFLRALVCMALWNWFLVFLGAPTVTVSVVAGLLLLFSFVKNEVASATEKDTESFSKNPVTYIITQFLISVLASGLTFGFGWLLFQFVS